MNLQTFFDNFELLAEAPNGVPKLRELILQLAVQGKLVPQDLNDEPAAALLQRIDIAKEVVKEKRIKKADGLPPLQIDAFPYSLPKNWEWVYLDRISNLIHYGYTASADESVKDVRLLRITDIQDNKVNWANVPGCKIDEKEIKNYKLDDGDIVIARTGGTIGKSYLVDNLSIRAVFASYLIRVVPSREVLPAYVKLFLESPLYWGQLYEKSMGTGQPNVNGTSLRSLLVPLPPLKEQKRIITKVDELMKLCDALEKRQQKRRETRVHLNSSVLEHLFAASTPDEFNAHWQRICNSFDLLYEAPETIGKLRQSILQLAVQGKLLPQDPDDEPAAVLLAQALKERGKKKLLLPSTNDPVPLLDGWVMVRMGDIVDHRLGKMLDKSKNKGTPSPYLRNTNVQWLRFNVSDIKEMRFEPDELDEYEVKVGDLLICEGGEPGRCAIWDGQIDKVMFQKAIHRVRPLAGINSWFLVYRLLADALSGYLERHFTGATIKHFTGQELARYTFPLPPLAEQKRIVAKVDQLMKLCDELEANLRKAQATSESLTASLV
jgi:type I restriction enzyme, S subunit